jgi:hypothetical protein
MAIITDQDGTELSKGWQGVRRSAIARLYLGFEGLQVKT